MTTIQDTIDGEAQTKASPRPPLAAIAITGLLLIAAVIFVVSSLRRPMPLTWYPVSVVDPQEVGDRLVGPSVFTVDGRGDELTALRLLHRLGGRVAGPTGMGPGVPQIHDPRERGTGLRRAGRNPRSRHYLARLPDDGSDEWVCREHAWPRGE